MRTFVTQIASILLLGLAACAATPEVVPMRHQDVQTNFFAAPVDAEAGLPEKGIYPNGRRLAFMGYSGKPERDLKNGFTVAGPVYGNQASYVEDCIHKGFPVVVQVGGPLVEGGFVHGKAGAKYDAAQVREAVQGTVDKYAASDAVVWWAVQPEDLRPWRTDEMAYLQLVTETVRQSDPKKRPIYIYNPNNRAADTLATIAKYVDIVGKGTYVNLDGKKNERAWVRWSIEQEIEGAKRAGRSGVAILIPELCADPAKGEEAMIEPWVRHDVYLGLCSGAKGVVIWSLFPRGGVKHTWQRWYDAYAKCGRELGDERHLGEVFLFGEARHDLKVQCVDGAATIAGTSGQAAGGETKGISNEISTTNEKERAVHATKYPAFTVCERAFGVQRYLFIVNSTAKPARFRISGWPAQAKGIDAFTGAAVALPDHGPREVELPAWGVEGLVLERR